MSWCKFIALFLASTSFPSGAGEVTSAAAPLYARTTNFFAETLLFKPLEAEPPGPYFSFAPLVLEERVPVRPFCHFGRLYLSNDLVRLNLARPTCYAALDTVELTPGSSHACFSYTWSCISPSDPGTAPPRLQGLRVILDAQGHPIIWQILTDSTGMQLFFVSQGLEAAAVARYGKPLERRRYAIERSVAEAPKVLVARTLDDAAVPMGPVVYLLSSGDVSTVICRCMPAQGRGVTGTRTYELVPFAHHEPLLTRLRDNAGLKPSFWPGTPVLSPKIRDLLRLP